MTQNDYFEKNRVEILRFLPEKHNKILEIGCGAGRFGKLCKEKNNAYVVGIEMNQKMAAEAAKVLDRVLVGDANIEIEKLPDNEFDLIVCNDILEHMLNPEIFLRDIKTKLKSNAVLVASIPNFRYISNLKHILFDKDFQYSPEGGILDSTHLRFFTKKSIVRFFKELNIEIVNIEGINEINYYRILKPLIKILGHADVLYLQFVCVCKF